MKRFLLLIVLGLFLAGCGNGPTVPLNHPHPPCPDSCKQDRDCDRKDDKSH